MKVMNLAARDVLARARQRGYSEESVRGCILEDRGARWIVDVDHPAYPRARDQAVPEPPSFLEKIKNFTQATVKHVAAGMPMATDGEVARRYAICMGCEFMKDGACTKCGCPLVREKKYISKLSWADSECPVGKWGKEKLPDGQ
jgi:hypothetical protein